MIPRDFENCIPNDIGRALREQCRKSMKDFVNPERDKYIEGTRACARCAPPNNRYDLEELTPHDRMHDGRRDVYYLCREHEAKYHPYLKGQGQWGK